MDKFAMIIFGASGDLTKRKLMPALYSLYRDKRLTGSFTVLGIGRTVYSDEDYRSYILGELQQFVKAEEQNLEPDVFFCFSFVLFADGSCESGGIFAVAGAFGRALRRRSIRIICCSIWLLRLRCMGWCLCI